MRGASAPIHRIVRTEIGASISMPSPGDHIMLSYAWAQQETVMTVRRELERHHLGVWMDVDSMHGNIYESMADAVIRASVVILFLSRDYERSRNCRKEAEFACRRLGLNRVIPVVLENGFPYELEDQDWLDILVGSRLYIDFSDCPLKRESPGFQRKIAKLLSEITHTQPCTINNITQSTSPTSPWNFHTTPDSSNSPNRISKQSTSSVWNRGNHATTRPVEAWTATHVAEWLCKAGLTHLVSTFVEAEICGKALAHLHQLSRVNSIQFFAILADGTHSLRLSLGSALAFSLELAVLFEKTCDPLDQDQDLCIS